MGISLRHCPLMMYNQPTNQPTNTQLHARYKLVSAPAPALGPIMASSFDVELRFWWLCWHPVLGLCPWHWWPVVPATAGGEGPPRIEPNVDPNGQKWPQTPTTFKWPQTRSYTLCHGRDAQSTPLGPQKTPSMGVLPHILLHLGTHWGPIHAALCPKPKDHYASGYTA